MRPEPIALTLSRLETPVGEMLIVTDAEDCVRALAENREEVERIQAQFAENTLG